MRQRIAGYSWIALLVAFLSLAQFDVVFSKGDMGMKDCVGAAEGVAEGLPHWRNYQSRVLGPFMVAAVQKATGQSFAISYSLMAVVWLAIFVSTLSLATISLGGSLSRVTATAFAAAFLNSLLMRFEWFGLKTWLYPWDFLDQTVLTLFIWALLANRSIGVLAFIVLLETFNREVSIIMAAWIVADSLFDIALRREELGEAGVRAAKQRIAVGTALAAASVIVTEWLRRSLIVREIGPELFTEGDAASGNWQFQLARNASDFAFSLTEIPSSLWVYNLLIFGVLAIALTGAFSRQRELAKICMFHCLLWLTTVLFGIAYECRVWISFVPFLVMAAPRVFASPDAASDIDPNLRAGARTKIRKR